MRKGGRWRKLGLLYDPLSRQSGDRHPKLLSHAANPLPVHIEGDVYRIFYSGRDNENRSSVGAVDIDILKRAVVRDHKVPFFEHGPPGSFYEAGVSVGNCYDFSGARYIGFMGWQNPIGEHWRGDIGRLAITQDMGLQLDSPSPMLGADPTDPVSLSYPWIASNESGRGLRMWYGSTLSWDAGNGEMLHVIKYATSDDGRQWQRKGLSVSYELGVAQAFSRPTVIASHDGGLDMWFSFRSGSGEKYRIGYAHSYDGLNFELELDYVGINVSLDGWDSEMLEYPYVLQHAGQLFMLYNGNGYGKTGFGLALYVEP